MGSLSVNGGAAYINSGSNIGILNVNGGVTELKDGSDVNNLNVGSNGALSIDNSASNVQSAQSSAGSRIAFGSGVSQTGKEQWLTKFLNGDANNLAAKQQIAAQFEQVTASQLILLI